MSNSAEAQYVSRSTDYYIRIDSLTRLPDKPIPFDKPFTMVLTPRSPQNIIGVNAYEAKRDKNKKPLIKEGEEPFLTVSPKLMGNQLIIEFPAIPPNFQFDFCLLRKLDSDKLDTFITYLNLVAKSIEVPGSITPTEMARADYDYQDFNSKLENAPFTYNGITSYMYDYMFFSTCSTDNSGSCNTRTLERNFYNLVKPQYLLLLNANVSVLNPSANFVSDLKDVSQIFKNEKFSDNSLAAIIRIYSNPTTVNNLKTGLISLNYNYQTNPCQVENIKIRNDNYNSIYLQLSKLQDTLERLVNVMPANASLNKCKFLYPIISGCILYNLFKFH